MELQNYSTTKCPGGLLSGNNLGAVSFPKRRKENPAPAGLSNEATSTLMDLKVQKPAVHREKMPAKKTCKQDLKVQKPAVHREKMPAKKSVDATIDAEMSQKKPAKKSVNLTIDTEMKQKRPVKKSVNTTIDAEMNKKSVNPTTIDAEMQQKKPAKKAIDTEINKKRVLDKHAEGKLSDLTVPDLKSFLSENKVKVSGKKEELIQRVLALLSSKAEPKEA